MRRSKTEYRLSFLDFKNLCDYILETYDFNLEVFSFTITKMRIDKFCINYNIKNYNELINYLKKNTFYKLLFSYLLVETTELFRDPDFWVVLKNKYLIKYLGVSMKIWVPDVTGDDELISLLIVLDELKMLEKAEIIVSSYFNHSTPETLFRKSVSEKKINYSLLNFNKYNENSDLLAYFEQKGKNFIPKDFLFQNVIFKHFALWADRMPEEEFDFVLFRNRMLFYNKTYVDNIYKNIYDSLKNKSFIAIGAKEKIEIISENVKFVKSEKNCNIYIKK